MQWRAGKGGRAPPLPLRGVLGGVEIAWNETKIVNQFYLKIGEMSKGKRGAS